jgi:hypothetical protein
MECTMRSHGLIFIIIMLFSCGSVMADVWTQSDWSGGPGAWSWADSSCFWEEMGMDWGERLKISYWRMSPKEWWKEEGVSILCDIQSLSDGTLAVGTNKVGKVFFSTDGGWTWEERGELEGLLHACSLAYDSLSGTLWAAGVSDDGYPKTEAMVFFSTDGGRIWEEGELPPPNVGMYVGELLLASSGELYLTRGGSGSPHKGEVLLSTDGGRSWDTTRTLPDGAFPIYLAELNEKIYVGTKVEQSHRSLGAGDLEISTGSVYEVFRLGGDQWVPTGFPDSMIICLYDLAATSDGRILAGVMRFDTLPGVFSYSDLERQWRPTGPIDQGEGASSVYAARDGVWWAGIYGTNGGGICRSRDEGGSWEDTGELPRSPQLVETFEECAGKILASTSGRSTRILIGSNTTGYLESSDYHPGYPPDWGAITWDASNDNFSNGQELVVRVRTGTDSSMSGAMDWEVCPACVNGQGISSLPSVNDGDRYVQYRVEMASESPEVSPVLYDISIEYQMMGWSEETPGNGSASRFVLCHPNPFSESTLLSYALPGGDHISLKVYDALGRLVRTLVEEEQTGGDVRQAEWDGLDETGRVAPQGVYFYRMVTTASKVTATGKLVLMR